MNSPGWIGVQYATGEEWRNSSRKNEQAEPKQKQCLVVDETGDGSKVQCCKEQYCLGTLNVRSMNQSKLEVILCFRRQRKKKKTNKQKNTARIYVSECPACVIR